MATFGTLKEFCPASDSMTTYLQRAKFYFTANKVPQELQVATLLTSIGASTYDRLCDLLAPDDPSTRTLKQISELLKLHFKPPRIEIAEQFHFCKREQAPGEHIVEYDAALRKLATHCNFGANLEIELRDQIVCGLQQESIQRQLLTKADLTYKRIIEMVKAAESAEKSAHTLRTTTAPVDQVNLLPCSGALQDQKKECYRRGGTIWQRIADLSWLYAIFARNADTLLVLVWPNRSQVEGNKPTPYRKTGKSLSSRPLQWRFMTYTTCKEKTDVPIWYK